MAGSPGAENPEGLSVGAALVLSGADGSVSGTSYGLASGSRHGDAVSILGDYNGDGVAEYGVVDPAEGFVFAFAGSVTVYSLAPPFLAEQFEVDASGAPVVNGQLVDAARLLVGGVRAWGSGAGVFGAAIFDSDPNGPNAVSDDPDLLVNRGNVLILQENGGMTGDVFDQPDDTVLGGVFHFEFAPPALLDSLDLIDICPTNSQDVEVILTDLAGSTRTYFVPGGFTDDITVGTGPGVQRLSLSTLEPQPGVSATATSAEDGAFIDTRVKTLDVRLSGSGAIDGLRFVPQPLRETELLYGLAGFETSRGIGSAMALVADIDGDGVSEILAGAPEDSPSQPQGRAIVISGATGVPVYTLVGSQANDEFGAAVSGIGDVDGDLVGDLLIGAPETSARGAAFVYSGATRALLRTHTGVGVSDDLGSAVVALGDANGDGVDDYAVGAIREPFGGAIRVFSGANGGLLYRLGREELGGGSRIGAWLAPIDDMDGDGVGDMVASIASSSAGGRCLVVSGRTGSILLLVEGAMYGVHLFDEATAIGDLTGDGKPDLVISAQEEQPLRRGAVVVDGVTGALVHRWTSQYGGGTVVKGFGLGDLDGDRVPEVAISALSLGEVRILSGASGLPIVTVTEGSTSSFEDYGAAVVTAPDINGDGIAEVLIGAPRRTSMGDSGLLIAVTLGGAVGQPSSGTDPQSATPTSAALGRRWTSR